jgi:hypothetical protein
VASPGAKSQSLFASFSSEKEESFLPFAPAQERLPPPNQTFMMS